MDEQQRRVWQSMLEQLDAYEAGDVTSGRLPQNLHGLLSASDIQDERVVREFTELVSPMYYLDDPSVELLTDPIADLRRFINQALSATSPERI